MESIKEILETIDRLVEFRIVLLVIKEKIGSCKREKEVADCFECNEYVDCKKIKKLKKSESNHDDVIFELKCYSKINRREILDREEKEEY